MSILETRKSIQKLLQPYYTGPIDGEFGPLTEKAFRAIATATDSLPSQTPSPIKTTGGNPRLGLVAEAQKLLGGRETNGANRSPVIDALWKYTSLGDYGWKNRQPYCAATVCACAGRAAEKDPRLKAFPLPREAAVANLLEWATIKNSGCIVFTPTSKSYRPEAGDIAIYLPNISHTGIVAQDYDGGGFIHTLEGNTNGEGSRDGDGFYAKTRAVTYAGHYIRIASTA